MLLPWSKPDCLSISPQGVALRSGKQLPQLLSEQAFVRQDETAFAKALEQHAALLKHKNIEVLLSNSLVRYCVLPWQEGVYRRDDWEAIAQHTFKKQFGSETNDWLVTVGLTSYQTPVLAVATDQALIEQLQVLSKQIGFTLAAITPLLAKLASIQKHSTQQWLCAVEPQRIVLLQKQTDECHQVYIDSPPANVESLHVQQLISRVLLQTRQGNNSLEQLPKPLIYVSNALKTSWDDSVVTGGTLAMPLIASQPHPVWMAGL